jgi:peptidoglycan/LPS O-acetylase OafA/YrhL
MTLLDQQIARLPDAKTRRGGDEPGHVPALDGVRGLAILLVMLTHFTLVQGGPVIDRLVGLVGRFGWSGVDLFFVLSGFLITGILLDNRGDAHYFRNFYARRTLRIFPLYYCVIFFATVLVPALPFQWTQHFPIGDALRPLYWLYLSNFAVAFGGDNNAFLGLTWSLAIEEQFYLVWPILVLLLSRRALMWACAGAVIVSVATRTAFVMAGADRLMAYVLTPCRMDGIAIGCMLGLVLHGNGLAKARALLPKARWVALGCAVAILAIIAYHGTTGFVGGPGQSVGYTVVSIFYACVLLYALGAAPGRLGARLFAQPWLRVLGKYSYALYLFHMGIARLIRLYVYDLDDFHTFAGSRLPGQALFYVLCFAPSLLAAWLSWHLLEKHFLKLKVLFPAKKRSITAAAWEGEDVARAKAVAA